MMKDKVEHAELIHLSALYHLMRIAFRIQISARTKVVARALKALERSLLIPRDNVHAAFVIKLKDTMRARAQL